MTSLTDDSDVVISEPQITTDLTSLLIDDFIAGTEYRFTVKAVGHAGIMGEATREIRENTRKLFRNHKRIWD